MLRRQVSRDDAPERLASSLALGRALPEALRPGQGEADRLGRERLLGFELTVEGAMGQTGPLAYRVDAGGADAVLPEQARGRGQDLFPIPRRSVLRDSHRFVPIPLDSAEDGGHEPIHDDRNHSLARRRGSDKTVRQREVRKRREWTWR